MEQRDDGGDPACWADEFPEYLGLDDAPPAPLREAEPDHDVPRTPPDLAGGG